MNDKDCRIQKELQKHYDYLQAQGYEVLGVFLYGSQNYGLEYENSDIDTKAIVLPKLEDYVLNKKPVSTSMFIDSKNICDIKDIRIMFDCFKKQNINFVEILFTKHRILNYDYEHIYKDMINNAEIIARYNNYASINCMSGMALEKYKALCHPYSSIKDRVEIYGYCNKQFHHILRLKEFIKRYAEGEPYSECLISKQSEYLIKIKSNYIYNCEDAMRIAKDTVDWIVDFKNEYIKNNVHIINREVEVLMNNVLLSIIKQCIKKELII